MSTKRIVGILALVAILVGIPVTDAVARHCKTGLITGHVFLDGSGEAPYDEPNGMWDKGEQGFAGVTLSVELYYMDSAGVGHLDDMSRLYRSGVTNADGYYAISVDDFSYLRVIGYTTPLAYQVKLTDDNGHGLLQSTQYRCTTDGTDSLGRYITKHGAGSRAKYYNISIPVAADGATVFNWPQASLPNYRQFMGDEWAPTLTDWSDFEAAEYQIAFVQTRTGSQGYYHRKHVDFGFKQEIQPAAIGNYVWEDLDRDGVQDSDEPGVPDVTVELHDASGVTKKTTKTDPTGYYMFRDLPPGKYSLKFVKPPKFEITAKNAGDETVDCDADSVSGETEQTELTSGEEDPTWDAGLYRLPEEKLELEKSASKMVGECKTIGFWKNNIKKALQRKTGGTQVTRAQLIQWLTAVRAYYRADPYKNLISAASEDDMLQAAYAILSVSTSDMRAKTLRQLLACELNLKSGDFAMVDNDAHDAFCRGAEDALNDAGADLGPWHDMADTINNLGNGSQDPQVSVGDLVAFTITVNSTLNSAKTVEIRDYLDSALSRQLTSPGGSAQSGFVSWNIDLAAGTSAATVWLIAKITGAPGMDAGMPAGDEWVASNTATAQVSTDTGAADLTNTAYATVN